MLKNLLNSLVLLLSFAAINAVATPVGPMNYQGRLLDDNGVPVTGSYNFVVRIYDDPAGGVLKYQETHNGVNVNDGVYAFRIGLGPKTGGDSEWDVSLWQSNLNDLYLEVEVNTEILTPRHELTSSPHAFTATLALAADSLGGKTATEFTNILEGVCVASQGKWFNKVDQCLGKGAVFNTPVTLADLMDPVDTDFSNLDLTDADISGITFANVSFANSKLVNTTINAGTMSNINFSGAEIDGLVSTNPLLNTPVDFTGATIHDVDMTNWDLTSATLTGSSSMNLDECPLALPTDWTCHDQSGGYKYELLWLLLGPGVNLSKTSLLADDLAVRDGVSEVKKSVISNANLQNANFEGTQLNGMRFFGTDLTGANFNNTLVQNGTFSGSTMTGVQWYNSDVMETYVSVDSMSAGMQDSRIKNVRFYFTQPNAYLDVVGSRLENVQFLGGANIDIIADNTTYFDNVAFMVPLSSLYLENAIVYNGMHFADGTTGLSFVDPVFYGGTISGDWTSANFSGGTFTGVSFAGADLSGATGLDGATFNDVNWSRCICPDGYITNYSYQTCVGHLTPP